MAFISKIVVDKSHISIKVSQKFQWKKNFYYKRRQVCFRAILLPKQYQFNSKNLY